MEATTGQRFLDTAQARGTLMDQLATRVTVSENLQILQHVICLLLDRASNISAPVARSTDTKKYLRGVLAWLENLRFQLEATIESAPGEIQTDKRSPETPNEIFNKLVPDDQVEWVRLGVSLLSNHATGGETTLKTEEAPNHLQVFLGHLKGVCGDLKRAIQTAPNESLNRPIEIDTVQLALMARFNPLLNAGGTLDDFHTRRTDDKSRMNFILLDLLRG